MSKGITAILAALTTLLLFHGNIGITQADDSLQLEGMAVFGNRELPKALFIVPWKDPDAAEAPDRPVNSLVDEALQPVDPDVFRRKLQYFETVHKTD